MCSKSVQTRTLYTAYGVTLSSELALPQLFSSDLNPECEIVYGMVSEELEDATERGVVFQAAPGRFLLNFPGVGRFLVKEGCRIVIDPDPQADEDDLRAFLLGSTLGALLHQRDVLALHGSAVRTEKGAVLLLGDSGAGKSTIAAGLGARGYQVMCDDICAIRLDQQGEPRLSAGFPSQKLWIDTAKKLELEPAQLARVRRKLNKFYVPLPELKDIPSPIRACYRVRTWNKDHHELSPVEDARCLGLLVNTTYRERFMQGQGNRASHFAIATALANSADFKNVDRKSGDLDPLLDLIEADFSS